MTKSRKPTCLVFFIFATVFLVSCSLDEKTIHYSDYKMADTDRFFEKGWIPKQIVYHSMTDIYLRCNLDVNTFVFSFSVKQSDLASIKKQLQNKQVEFANPKGLSIPNWWTNKAKNLKYDVLKLNGQTNSVFIGIDIQKKHIYGYSS